MLAAALGSALAVHCVWRWRTRTPDPELTAEILRLRALLRRHEESLANTAHELRTPLTAVMTALELLREVAESPQDRETFFEQATVAAQHMAFLLNDLVDMAAMEAGQISLSLRQHHARDLADDARRVLGLMAQARERQLQITDPPEDLLVVADKSRVLQIVFNLVSNAFKYSTNQSVVQVHVRAEPPWCTFEVTDFGKGVPQELRPYLFTRFGRAHDAKANQVESTGLGLHVCKLLVEKMGGTITYRPGTSGGSVFAFTLPTAPASVPSPITK